LALAFRYRGSRRESAVAQLFSLGILATSRISFWCVEVLMQPRVALSQLSSIGIPCVQSGTFLPVAASGFQGGTSGSRQRRTCGQSTGYISVCVRELVAFVVSQFGCIFLFWLSRMQMPNKSPEPTAVGACSPLSRSTSRVGGGSAFFVRHQDRLSLSWSVWLAKI